MTGAFIFLYTDIEGSSRLWEEQPKPMALALARHDAIARDAVIARQGQIVKTTGDGMCAVFPEASNAVAAALAMQVALADPASTAGVAIRVRCGLHAGQAEQRERTFFGSTLNRAERIMAAAHGGQVLLSKAAADLVRDRLPAKSSLLDLGTVRLRDLASPEHIYQLVHSQLPQEFPALRSLESTPNNLPQQVTSFVGRIHEVAQARRLLASERLLTLTGAGGIGKTRLSLQVAVDFIDEYPDGVWFVELASLFDPALVPKVVAQVLAIREEPNVPALATVCAHLKSRRLLLVLDNCEHLVHACAGFVDALLHAAPYIGILVTSREPLNISGEQIYALPPLSLVSSGEAHAGVHPDAVQLFLERARSRQPEFALTEPLIPTVTKLCARLDGIPLALELAAARVGVLSVEGIAERLNDRFHLLTGGSRTALPRQQTLRAMIDWSYDLLADGERTLFSRLSVFMGGWTLDAAEAVGADNDIARGDVLNLLTSLVHKSLVVRDESGDRYRMLETIRQYGRNRLQEGGAEKVVCGHHRDYFLALAEEAEPSLDGGREQPMWLARLELEHDNLRAALAQSRDDPESPDVALRLCGALYRFWAHRGHAQEGRDWCAAALARSAASGPTHIKALHALGVLTWRLGDVTEARMLLEQALERSRAIDDRAREARVLSNLGGIAVHQGDAAAAHTYLEQAVAIHRSLGEATSEARCLNNLNALAISQGNFAAAQASIERAIELSRELGDRMGESNAVSHLACLAQHRCDYAVAQALHEQALITAQEFGVRGFELEELRQLGAVGIARGEMNAARTFLLQALVGSRESGDLHEIAECLDFTAMLAVEEVAFERAAILAGAADALHEAIRTPRGYTEREYHNAVVGKCRETLGEVATAKSLAAGRSMTPDQAAKVALAWLENAT